MRIKKGGSVSSSPSSFLQSGNTIYVIIISILLIIIICGLVLYFTTPFALGSPKITQNVSVRNETPPLDDFYNVYTPPLRDNPYFPPFSRSYNNNSTGFTQIGILKYKNNNDNAELLPLFGRPLSTSRNQWQYYTLSNNGTNPSIKLTLRNDRGRNSMDDIGVAELYDDDNVIVDGYDKQMLVSLYKQKQMYYI
jgi:hypothetical protein